jgi:hypothetical protein
LGLILAATAMLAPAADATTALLGAPSLSAARVVQVDYRWHGKHYAHRRWDKAHRHWSYY